MTILPLCLREEVTQSDIETVGRLTRSSGFFTEAEVDIAVELVNEALNRGAQGGYRFLFAQQGDGCLGYACYGPSDDPPGWYDLYWLAVDGRHRGRGIGSWLLDAVEFRAVGRRAMGLVVETSGTDLYAPSRAFYESHGFWRYGVFADYYGAGDDMVVYRKRFSPAPNGQQAKF